MTRLLSLVGLMRVSEHERLAGKLDDEAFAAWNKAKSERDKFRDQVRDTCLRAEKAEASAKDWRDRHASVVSKLETAEAKFKKAITDLEKQAGEIADWRTALERMKGDRDNWRAQALRDEPDALAMRRKRQMDRDRRKPRV